MGQFHLLKWEGIIFPRGSGNIILFHLRVVNVIPFRNEGISSCNLSINTLKNHENLKIMEMKKTIHMLCNYIEALYIGQFKHFSFRTCV